MSSDPTIHVYVPIYDDIAGLGPRTIVGFGYVQWSYNPAANPPELTLAKKANKVGFGNVSAALALDLIIPGSSTTRFLVSNSLYAKHYGLGQPLYSPVLVNRFIGPSP